MMVKNYFMITINHRNIHTHTDLHNFLDVDGPKKPSPEKKETCNLFQRRLTERAHSHERIKQNKREKAIH
ncbi:hypothetical protein VNO77_24128 [Canavalia gladiata]|uniref:Uncharacterized protein n=1 Tax=Canavalia gladiata TaxID=3824 RepID=A0AAN9QC71_CANGL